MPGLSQYKPNRFDDEEAMDRTVIEVDPPMSRDEDIFAVDPTIFDRMRQRYEESLGFADLKRTAPSWMQHEMMNNIPRSEWDKKAIAREPGERQEIFPDMWMQQYNTSDPFTLRQIMELLNKLSPNEQQGP